MHKGVSWFIGNYGVSRVGGGGGGSFLYAVSVGGEEIIKGEGLMIV